MHAIIARIVFFYRILEMFLNICWAITYRVLRSMNHSTSCCSIPSPLFFLRVFHRDPDIDVDKLASDIYFSSYFVRERDAPFTASRRISLGAPSPSFTGRALVAFSLRIFRVLLHAAFLHFDTNTRRNLFS